MENNAELVRLEEFVDKLLGQYNRLKSEYHGLQATLQDRDREIGGLKQDIEGLQQQITELSSERTEVGSRVSGLIDRIEQWESEHAGAPEGGMQGALFEDAPEQEG